MPRSGWIIIGAQLVVFAADSDLQFLGGFFHGSSFPTGMRLSLLQARLVARLGMPEGLAPLAMH